MLIISSLFRAFIAYALGFVSVFSYRYRIAVEAYLTYSTEDSTHRMVELLGMLYVYCMLHSSCACCLTFT